MGRAEMDELFQHTKRLQTGYDGGDEYELTERKLPETYACDLDGCDKVFKHPSDLTKHVKTHERLWKCFEAKCKYYELGWPTEKERDRHFNEKHLSTPPLYRCLFEPCPYTSKRESNCKQHMEMKHGLEYVRSKNNNRSKASLSAVRLPKGSVPPSPSSTMLTPTKQSEISEQTDQGESAEDSVRTRSTIERVDRAILMMNQTITSPQADSRIDSHQQGLERLLRERHEVERRDPGGPDKGRVQAVQDIEQSREDVTRTLLMPRSEFKDADPAKAADTGLVETAFSQKVDNEHLEAEDREDQAYHESLKRREEVREQTVREKGEEQQRIDQIMRRRLRASGITEKEVERIMSEETNISVEPGTGAKSTAATRRLPGGPVYPKIHRDYLSIDTLRYYDIPWEYDRVSYSFVLIDITPSQELIPLISTTRITS